jgi:hypothetical protein
VCFPEAFNLIFKLSICVRLFVLFLFVIKRRGLFLLGKNDGHQRKNSEMEGLPMEKRALVYVKGLTQADAYSDIKSIESYCSANELKISEILYDESQYDEKDYDCLMVLYNQMKSNAVTTIIFDSCYYHYSLATSIEHLSLLTGIEVLNFHNGKIQDFTSKSKSKDVPEFNQSMVDKLLTVDFGNWIGSLSKNRGDIHYIDREEDARIKEIRQRERGKAIKDSRKDKGILGIVFDETNLDKMTGYVQKEMFLDKTSYSRVVVYEGFYELEELLQNGKYYRVICDEFANGDIDDLRDLIILCDGYSVEVCFWEGELSTYQEYELGTFLDAITGNL